MDREKKQRAEERVRLGGRQKVIGKILILEGSFKWTRYLQPPIKILKIFIETQINSGEFQT